MGTSDVLASIAYNGFPKNSPDTRSKPEPVKRPISSPEMTNGQDTVRKLLVAHFQGDEAAFRSAAWEVVKHERRLNHGVLANDLERILNEANGTEGTAKKFFSAFSATNGNLPKDKEKNAWTTRCFAERPSTKSWTLIVNKQRMKERGSGSIQSSLKAHSNRRSSAHSCQGQPNFSRVLCNDRNGRLIAMTTGIPGTS